MKKFEYLVIYIWEHEPELLQKELNSLGDEGWELMSKETDSKYEYIFKREKITNISDTTI